MTSPPFLTTKYVPLKTYKEFIISDFNSSAQKDALIQLSHVWDEYAKEKLKDHTRSVENTFIAKESTVDWDFEVYRMKKHILQNTPYKINPKIKPILTESANQILILAMLYNRVEIVKYLIGKINTSAGIFGSALWPSYFLLACSCDSQIFEIFKKKSINYKIAWNGLTPHLLCAFAGNTLWRTADLDFLNYQEFYYLNLFRGVHLQKTKKTYPIFILDFLCMKGDTLRMKELLERVPEAGYLSRLNFIVQNEEHQILILTRYGYRFDQEFNGNTPLHYSCLNGDLYTFTFLLYAGFPIVKDSNGLFPNEVGRKSIIENANKLFSLCVGPLILNEKGEAVKRIFSSSLFKEQMLKWINILKYSSAKYAKYAGGFRYLDFNRENRILRGRRFTVVSVLSLTKSPIEVENDVQKSLKKFVAPLENLNVNLEYHTKFLR